MRATNLVVAMALLLSATSAALAQDRQCSGDRPYYDYDSSGWLDDNYHPGIDCNVVPRVHSLRAPLAHPSPRMAGERAAIGYPTRLPSPLAGEDRSRASAIR
jgi:hypothetical protein